MRIQNDFDDLPTMYGLEEEEDKPMTPIMLTLDDAAMAVKKELEEQGYSIEHWALYSMHIVWAQKDNKLYKITVEEKDEIR